MLTTFSDTLANALKLKLKRLVNNEPRITERLEVYSLDSIGRRLYEINYGRPNIVSRKVIEDILQEYLQKDKDNKFSLHFLIAEWEEVVDAWQLETWDAYRDVLRLGRKTRLPEKHVSGSGFLNTSLQLKAENQITYAGLFSKLAFRYEQSEITLRFYRC